MLVNIDFSKISYWSNAYYKIQKSMIKLRIEIVINSMAGFFVGGMERSIFQVQCI